MHMVKHYEYILNSCLFLFTSIKYLLLNVSLNYLLLIDNMPLERKRSLLLQYIVYIVPFSTSQTTVVKSGNMFYKL